MKKILLTGHTGFIGKNVKKHLGKKHEIIGLSRNATNNPKDIILNLATDFNTEKAINNKIDAIIHLAAQSNVNECETNKTETHRINVDASVKLATYAFANNIPFVFASSDQVYCGTKAIYTENEMAQPLNVYGKQKLQAEKEILSIYPKAVILRFALVIGENGGYEKALVNNLNEKKTQTLFTDEIRSVIAVEDLCLAVEKALQWNGGIYNLGGNIALSRFELGVAIAQKHHLDVSLLKKGWQSDVKMLAKRPKNVILNSDKAIENGFVNATFKTKYLL
ncbi:MAG: sugar nucleotide-binding protein [Chitinophagales bacterium]|nr:sugar nucleotide-binding protein [Chitinophagales bacterium]